MFLLFVGIALFAVGVVAASNSLRVVKQAAWVWPRPLDRRDGEAMASYEFLVRFVGLVVALIGIGLILAALIAA